MQKRFKCGECKLQHRVLLRDQQGQLVKDQLGRYVFDVFTCDCHQKMVEHLITQHAVAKDSIMSEHLGWGICTDCGHYFGGNHLPLGHSSAGGDVLWCYDCAGYRCQAYGMLRSNIIQLLQRHGMTIKRPISDQELITKLKALLELQE